MKYPIAIIPKPVKIPIANLAVSPIQFLSIAYFTKYPIPITKVKIPIMVRMFCFTKLKTSSIQVFSLLSEV
jgi:hypothetical protein